MASATPPRAKGSKAYVIIGALSLVAVLGTVEYISRDLMSPKPYPEAVSSQAKQAAKQYVHNLELSDVTMQASESFTNQQLVEVQGKIANKGNKALRSVKVFCLFYTPEGKEMHRERSTVVSARQESLTPGQTRQFRLPFDALPPGWNQAVPRMVIADITFAE